MSDKVDLSETLTFRVDPEMRVLLERIARRNKARPGQIARTLLNDALQAYVRLHPEIADDDSGEGGGGSGGGGGAQGTSPEREGGGIPNFFNLGPASA